MLTVRDASRAQIALVGAPGRLSVIDTKTVYLRLPDTFIEPEALLIVLRNLMRQAYDRERNGEPAPVAAAPAPIEAKSAKSQPTKAAKPSKSEGARRLRAGCETAIFKCRERN